MMRTLRLAFRMMLRDLRAGELHLLGLAIVIAVASLTSVGFLAEVLRRFAASHLQPRRFVLQTRQDQVDDWFWLEPSEVGKTEPLTPAAPSLT